MTHNVLRVTTLVAGITMAACAPSDKHSATVADVLTIATPADADALLPPLVQSTQGKQVTDMVFDYLAQPDGVVETVGDARFRPQLATRWDWAPDSLSVTFHLNANARWHDGAPVRAADVRFSHALYVDPAVASPLASAFANVDSVTARDSTTAVVWWHARHPEQFFQFVYSLAILPQHLLDTVPRNALASSAFATHPIGSGRYRFEQWIPRTQLVVAADTANYRGAPAFGRIIWMVAADPTAASMRVLAGQADMLELVRGDVFGQVRASTALNTVEYGSFDYAYLLFNMSRPIAATPRAFSNHALRAALTQSLDRAAIVANALDSLGQVALGPFTRSAPSVDSAMRQFPYDTVRASQLLDSLGWVRNANDGMRRRGSQRLQFEMLVPSSSSTRMRIAVLLQEQFRRLGIATTIAAVEPGVFFDRLEKGNFETALNMWRAVPSPSSLADVWGSPPSTGSTVNFGRYSNATFDAVLDSAVQTFNAGDRHRLLQQAYQLIVDDAAAVWLYEPRNYAAINRRITPVGMRADAWWADIPDWKRGAAGAAGATGAN